MAGWKLRKDKASAETAGAETETSSPEASPTEAPFLDAVPGLPDFDTESGPHLTSLEFDHAAETPGHDDGPLTLVDYTDPGETHAQEPLMQETLTQETLTQEPHAQVYDTPSVYDTPLHDFSQASALAMPPPEATEHDIAEHDTTEQNTDFETIPASSSWLSSDFGADTPSVAPFVLDTPAPSVAPPAAPQIIIHIGRLSAPFDLTKDVTTIGRPDSILPYYPDVEIEMDDAVSRRHAEIVKREGGYYLVDTGSTNGTRLNGETLLPHQEHLLTHGDRIHLGDRTEITFE